MSTIVSGHHYLIRMNKKQKQFSRIYNLYVDHIYRFIYIKVSSRQIAEDLTSEVFLNAWKKICKKDDQIIQNPKAYFYKIARNTVVDFYRTNKKEIIISDIDNQQIEDTDQRVDEQEKTKSDLIAIQKELANLKPEYQDVIIWRYVDGLSIKEISQILNKSRGATRVTIHRAIKQLKKQLSD